MKIMNKKSADTACTIQYVTDIDVGNIINNIHNIDDYHNIQIY
jgi:hypothetical protein